VAAFSDQRCMITNSTRLGMNATVRFTSEIVGSVEFICESIDLDASGAAD
jgi:hypothetical protein